ncbi:MAG: hypothetical protein LPK09_06820 [Hymenobacteraceae bacterium]|nr:hypothetical protein [Hymenobacteraceae bacterium]
MKKLMYTGAIVLGTLGMIACNSGTDTTTDSDERVIETDTVSTEYEVERTTVETDTTTETETIEMETDNQ